MRTVSVQIGIVGGNADEIDRLARQFRQELLGLDVEAVAVPSGGTAPSGAKGDPVTIGTLIVTMANSAVLAGICQVARAWVTGARGRHIMIKDGDRSLEIDGASASQMQQVIDKFLAGAQPGQD